MTSLPTTVPSTLPTQAATSSVNTGTNTSSTSSTTWLPTSLTSNNVTTSIFVQPDEDQAPGALTATTVYERTGGKKFDAHDDLVGRCELDLRERVRKEISAISSCSEADKRYLLEAHELGRNADGEYRDRFQEFETKYAK